jgi:DNA-binding transcriptional LysR family regulator
MSAVSINLHQLKLFYYVAKFGGIRAAIRNMPERVQPSTISRQVVQLEKDLGLSLLQRRPFRPTPAGEQIYAVLKPVIEGLPVLLERLRRGQKHKIRVGAPPVVMRDYIPSLEAAMERQFPDLQLELHEGLQWQLLDWFKEDRLDLAVTMLGEDPPEGCQCERLLRLPMVLLVHPELSVRSAAEFWQRRLQQQYRLFCPRANDAITRSFHQGLQKLKVEWTNRREANSIEIAESHVRKGMGVAVSLSIPGRPFAEGLRALPLPGFPLVPVGMLWRPEPNAATRALMDLLRQQAQRMTKRS